MLREINDRAALEVLLRDGPLTRSELEVAIGLSKPATAQLLTRLEQDGIVAKAGVRGGGRGPRAQLWQVDGGVAYVAAVDLTPQQADFVVADVAGAVLAEYQVPLPVHEGADVVGTFGAALTSVANSAGLAATDLRHVVIGAQGAFDPRTGLLSSAPHIPGWLGFDVPGRLSRELGVEVTIENDVNLVAIVEMTVGQAVGLDDFVMIWLSDGVGGAVVVGRRLLRGATGGGGEIDWMRVPDPVSVATPREKPRAGDRFGDLVASPAVVELAAAHGIEAETGADAVLKAREGHNEAFLDDLARRVAGGAAGLIAVVDPELVLLSGDTSRAGGDEFAALVARRLHELVLPRTPVGVASVQGNAVRAGALQSALATVRRDVFGVNTPSLLGPRRSGAGEPNPIVAIPDSRTEPPSPAPTN
ncbi:Sugar kinase of the NBD/HSP70 family, may contain an N-terminal HTH domain [Amycolatopsis lurida]|uniref:ROK family transcriptional regulator n=1 Tax=Amycolatopsis lurida NRRL 2430 TaxID=1460371 RepID=A0A2P2FRX6_AMYLU|nr:ROK family transcriptional regulator [Amycolatopsis lurida]KFU79484.1 ROK family transcriptional regulator [Amycolatopsis lurida NRRL 2430]SED20683.1 Sugar kinase of the NBD/HSP70 family, may contain an N-terminal HTH domain [Amycolatopsis lurida]